MELIDRLVIFLEYLTPDLLRLIQLFHPILLSPLNLIVPKSISFILAARYIRYVKLY